MLASRMGVAGCAGAADSAGALLDCSVLSFLLQAASTSSAHNASKLTVIPVQPVFLFIMSPFLGSYCESKSFVIPSEPERTRRRPEESAVLPKEFYREPPAAVGCDSTAACFRLLEGCTAARA